MLHMNSCASFCRQGVNQALPWLLMGGVQVRERADVFVCRGGEEMIP